MHLDDPQVRTSEVTESRSRPSEEADERSRPDAGAEAERRPSDEQGVGHPRYVPLGESYRELAAGETPGARLILKVAVGAVFAVAILLRFWTRSPLWLDEALTVNIARAPLSQIPGLLRHDGAPPLFYYLLHFWMGAFGQSDLAVRSLSGLIGVVNLPIAWIAGYRIGSQWWTLERAEASERAERERRGRIVAWGTTLLLAASPFAVYYDTEARMYGLVILLGTLGVIAYTSVLRRPDALRAIGLAAVTAALLYSHYWSLYAVVVVGAGTAWCALKGRQRRAARVALAGMALGCVAFIPWVPTFLFQVRHTGTPWAMPAGLTSVVYTLTQFAGGNSVPGRLLAIAFFFLVILALLGAGLDARRVVLDLRTRPGVRVLFLIALLTLVCALVAGRLSGSTFAVRYTSLVVAPALIVVAFGLTALADAAVRNSVLGVAVVLSLAAAVPNAFDARTQAGDVAAAITAGASPGDVVAYCPDQLGPAVSRLLPQHLDQLTFPRSAPPQIVDWVDYLDTVRAASPASFAAHVEALAGPSHTIWYVWAPDYVGFGNDCQAIAEALGAQRRQTTLVTDSGAGAPFEVFEGEYLERYTPR